MIRFLSKALSAAGLLACGAAAYAASAAGAAQAAGAGHLSAAQIVERNVSARGGLQSWRAVNAMRMSGQIDVGGTKNTRLPFVMTMKRPHKNRFEIRFDGQTAYQIYDGAQGWKIRPFLGRSEAEPYTRAELASAASSAELDGPLIDYANKGASVALLGTEFVEKHRAYVLKLTTKDNVSRRVWIDASSFLELKIDGEPRKLDGRMHNVAIFYRDYRKEGALVVPHTLETVVAGVKETRKLTIEQVAVNQPTDDALFAKPQPAAAKVSSR
ncbi:hypothetical protein WS62_08590 [Burkholderia sp. ABCPW 14]|uniref:hypothetical protein n=1 Tax=Burkholderia sp. ABCPW 14 TaxID=1637860 RepID=UPI000770D46F|nr:hypothetical protein [Burkholderia sp. ABCPW 14]KVD73363.1 hypothetical protein WS62_08590 [Burkholderia sp. ABCPW 14]